MFYNYNKMGERFYHVDEEDDGGDGDRCGGLHDDVVDGDGFPATNSPSGHLSEARVWYHFVVDGCVSSGMTLNVFYHHICSFIWHFLPSIIFLLGICIPYIHIYE